MDMHKYLIVAQLCGSGKINSNESLCSLKESVMPKIDSNAVRVCKRCGAQFHPTSSRQMFCNQELDCVCAVCGEHFITVCGPGELKRTCSSKCQAILVKQKREMSASGLTKKCAWCGQEFIPKSVRDRYCHRTHYQTCSVCGKQFEIDVRKDKTVKTCSKECRYILAQQHTNRESVVSHQRANLMSKYGVSNPAQIDGVREKIIQTNLQKYGKMWYRQTDQYAESVKATSLEKYGTEHFLQSREVIEKREATNLAKYGSINVASSEWGKQRIHQSFKAKYGVDNPSQYSEFKKKATRNARSSKLEQRVCQLLANYQITYIQHYFLREGDYSHEFDFYLPDYKLLIDADGLYFHSYLNDPDGVRVRDDYDEVRLHLVPEDHMFYLIVETQEDRQIKELVHILENSGHDLASHDSELFKWCRSIEFPYPTYTADRMQKDWKSLQLYYSENYVPQCRIGLSLVKNFHPSLYHCHVNGMLSPFEGWNDDEKLKKVIRNRLIYKNDVDPSKVLAGFNISKICPCVSIFNPTLAKYLICKYLHEFNTVFDPFSGFSGRLLGTVASGKRYIGHDLNEIAVSESNDLIRFLTLSNEQCSIVRQDVLDSSGEYECLLTCPPYSTKETYNNEVVFKSCDEWIDECLARFNCKKYVFVVDETAKYADNITEEIRSDSHFSHSTEKVIVL